MTLLKKLSLNFDKTFFIQFTKTSTCTSDIQNTYEGKEICTAIAKKFLGLFVNNTLSWKTHIECVNSKPISACCDMRSVKPYVSINTLKMIYYSYCHFVMTYGLLFWGYSSDSVKIFMLQKKIIRIMMHCRISDTCRKLYFKLGKLPLTSQYIYPLLFL